MSNVMKKVNMFSSLKESISDGTLNADSNEAVKEAIRGLVKESIRDIVDLAFKKIKDDKRLEEIINFIPQDGFKYAGNLTIIKNDAYAKLNDFKVDALEIEHKSMVKRAA